MADDIGLEIVQFLLGHWIGLLGLALFCYGLYLCVDMYRRWDHW